jgi:alanine racemase
MEGYMRDLHRRTWVEVDLDAVRHNYNEIKKYTKAKICCVIKADAYGHGAVCLAREYEKLGADFLAVSNIEEALQIREEKIQLPILILGYTPPTEAKTLSDNNLSQCVYSTEYGQELSENAVAMGVKVKSHIKIDTGMSRIGFYYQDINRDTESVDEVEKVCHLNGLIPEGIFTHFAVSDEGSDGDSFTMRQFGCFKEMIEDLDRRGIVFEYRHCANSAAITDFPLCHLDMVRAGIILYGLQPSEKVRNKAELIPVLSLKSVVSHVKKIEPGTTVSYGRTYTAKEEKVIATIPIGYADGYIRNFAVNGAEVLIHGEKCPIVGRICMDQLMVDVTKLENVSMEDVAILIGKEGDSEVSANDLAKANNTINYEILCNIGVRVPRIYMSNGREKEVLDYICSIK